MPALSLCTRPESTNTSAQITTNKGTATGNYTTPSDTSSALFLPELEKKLDAAFAKLLEITMTKLEEYIYARLTAALDEVIKFTTALVNTVQPKESKTIQSTVNNTAKRLKKEGEDSHTQELNRAHGQ